MEAERNPSNMYEMFEKRNYEYVQRCRKGISISIRASKLHFSIIHPTSHENAFEKRQFCQQRQVTRNDHPIQGLWLREPSHDACGPCVCEAAVLLNVRVLARPRTS